jgi:hypothetical protein
MDCVIILFSLQCKLKWEIVRILSDPNSPLHSRSRSVAVAAAVKVARAEAIAAAAPQERKALSTELSEEGRKVRQMEPSGRLLWRIP